MTSPATGGNRASGADHDGHRPGSSDTSFASRPAPAAGGVDWPRPSVREASSRRNVSGGLLLRFADGAGESSTLEMLLPFALDGDKSQITASHSTTQAPGGS